MTEPDESTGGCTAPAVSEALVKSWRPPLFDHYSLACCSSDADRDAAIDSFVTAIAMAWGCDDKLSLKDIDAASATIGRAISERTRSYMFPGDNTIWEGAPFGVVDVDGILLRFRALGPPPTEDLRLTRSVVAEALKSVTLARVRIMEPAWLRIPLLAIRDPATGEAIIVDGHHRMVRLWLDGVRTAQAHILEAQAYAPFLFPTFAELKASCFQNETISPARLRVIFSENLR